jgi:hypothetical protein
MDIFFHVYLKSGYSRILLDKFKKIRLSGLYEKTNKIYLTLFGDDLGLHSEFLNELKEVYPKIEYVVITNQEFLNEPDTLNFMLKKASEYDTNTAMLYLHTKGVSYANPYIKKNIDAWVRYLDLYVIKQWEECVKALERNDAAGGLYVYQDPKHFSGNFWWANSDYIKTLPKINPYNVAKLNRGEFWILSGTDKVYSVQDNTPEDRYANYVINENDFPDGW